MQTAHHAAVFYVGLFPLTDIFQCTNHLAVSCFEYSALESAYSQTKIILTGALSSVLFEIFRNLSYFETKGYFSINLLKRSLGSRMLHLNGLLKEDFVF